MINSMLSNPNYTSSIEEHEPFDPRLWEKAKQAAREEEDLIEEIAALRRKVPGIAVENARSAWKRGLEEDESVLAQVVQEARKRGLEEDRRIGVGTLERGDEVEAAWSRGVQGLEGLKGSLPETVAKAERAGRAEGYVLEKEKR